jgi:hypothetical protein
MSEYMVNDLVSAMRSFDVLLRQHVKELDETAPVETPVKTPDSVTPSPICPPTSANNTRKDKVNALSLCISELFWTIATLQHYNFIPP